ncbi:MAG: type I DNA topoisomerase [Clostridia bacterium]|nr:type I DNA topoisomerase [Clostridia bacterium]
MKLVIIEGPGKKETLKKYLGSGYEVVATKGHVRDLDSKKLSVDIVNNFTPHYEIMPDKKNIVAELKKKADKSSQVLLATDPDREGEAISWHISHILNLDPKEKCRIEFNEISKKAVENALTQPREINQQLVDAQQARRILDRIVGYKLSPIICKAIKPKLSAGRVQSIALKLVVDREKEIRDFKPEEYWIVSSDLSKKDNKKQVFRAFLNSYKNKKIKPSKKEEVDRIVSDLNSATYTITKIKKSKTKSRPYAPFTTSTMQQDALNKLGMSLSKTSFCAQSLYEGVDIADEGKIALITYIRTDSTRVSPDAINSARNFISEKYGKQFIPEKPNIYASKKNAQDAHEAIRPISIEMTPEKVKSSLKSDVYKLYKLIYERFLASQMTPAIYDSVTIDIAAGDYSFRATGRTLDFEGYTIIYGAGVDNAEVSATVERAESAENATNSSNGGNGNEGKDETEEFLNQPSNQLPKLEENEILNFIKLNKEQKFTKPPARYTEASLVKAMEEKGIGRPATYAPTITVLALRGYTIKENRSLKPTELGETVSNFLDKYFKSVINVKFTANMETRLDDIAEKGEKWQNVVASFWDGFKGLLESATKNPNLLEYKIKPIETDEICDLCGNKMLLRESRYGKFLGCSNFPKCRNIKKYMDKDIKSVAECPLCGEGIIPKRSKAGKLYYGCQNFPDCKFMSWDIPTTIKCPECNNMLYKKQYKQKTVFKCNNCNYKTEKEESSTG